MSATLQDVARMAGVHASTVSRVLSGHSAYGVNALATFCGILAGVVVYGILVVALRILRAEDVKSLPKGEKIAKLLHLK